MIASLTWQHRFFGDYATSISAFYDGHTGQPYSWVFGNDVSGIKPAGLSAPPGLMYIPRPGDVQVDVQGKIRVAQFQPSVNR